MDGTEGRLAEAGMLILESLDLAGVRGASDKLGKLESYFEMIRENRKWASLVSKRAASEPARIALESLSVIGVISHEDSLHVAEIGSGGGILGITLAIACEAWRLFLIESNMRKAAFLAEVVGRLTLENVTVLNSRAESVVGRRAFDCVLSRAAGRLDSLVPLALSLLKPGGEYIALKGWDVSAEVTEFAKRLENSGAAKVSVRWPAFPPALRDRSHLNLVVVQKL